VIPLVLSRTSAKEKVVSQGSAFPNERVANAVIAVVGLGYVGLTLAQAFAKHNRVIGFDTNVAKANELNHNNNYENLVITGKHGELGKADFIIIAVPTPVKRSKEPDLSYVEKACRIIKQHIRRGTIVIMESTVYPGVTEEIAKPILEESGLKCGRDFKIAYSPERINPGDEVHGLANVTKVVSGMDEETTEIVAELYGRICPSVFKARDIRTAEAAKVIENIQRDLNIALVNEFALIFEKLGLITREVLRTAATKWNFVPYSPGLVGGHCIPVDPYYLVSKAEEVGYHPQVILAGRATNEYMSKHVGEIAIKALNHSGKVINRSRALIMGLTYKENVPDTRESPSKGVIKELKEFGVQVFGFDPLVKDIDSQFDIGAVKDINSAKDIDCIIITVGHTMFKELKLEQLLRITRGKPVLVDVRGLYDSTEVERIGFVYRTL
jgi:UDP-N-acetyl-D-glucosamine/UDP-N-acetyl-D-galactosamine dehydrogenase